jgi:hypothetical protein
MADEPKNNYRYQVLRYTPNIERDEWVNIGVLLEEFAGGGVSRQAVRLIEQQSEFARIRRLHPDADEGMLRLLAGDFDSRMRPSGEGVGYLKKLDGILSNALQLSPHHAVLATDFDAELDRLFHNYVAVPTRTRGGIIESTRAWIKQRINDVFLRRRVPKLERGIPVAEFTEPGDPLRLDYGYRNGVRGFVHAVALGRDPAQPKILAYTAKRVREKIPGCEFTAVTEVEPSHESSRHQFVARLFADEGIQIVPLPKIERFAEDLRLRLQ